MKQQQRVLKVEAESSEKCLEKIKGVLAKLRETSDIDTWREETDGTVMVWGYSDPEKLKIKLENEAGDAIKSITDDPTNSIHSSRDGTVIFELENEDVLGQPQGLPEKRVNEVADSSHEILYHSQKTIESRQSRPSYRRWLRRHGEKAFSSRIPAILVADVSGFDYLSSESKSEPQKKSGCCCW
ncbi:uncharacterized protein LOC121983255 isoform X1 [Zingiber officinale]|uniref:uncharacterized protein LOC121983255 isoform X1 n=1 Tax=Zingiber officinale TaxID=94328 RepID=UPI001C4BDCC8|nr:uncharacterized protein LOC121983255 isoform X1 [Zingiber officinale]